MNGKKHGHEHGSVGNDPTKMKEAAAENQLARMISGTDLTAAEQKYGGAGGEIKSWRILVRSDDVRNLSRHNPPLGMIQFDAQGPASRGGTTNRAVITHALAGHPEPGDNDDAGNADNVVPQAAIVDGKAEIELYTHNNDDGNAVWVNALNGEVNTEAFFLEDGVTKPF